MSQFYVGVTAGALPPAVPLQFTTDSGVAVPVANNLNILANDTTANDTDGITTSGAGDTVTVLLTNRLQGTVTTANSTSTPIITFTPTVVGTYAIECRIAAYNTTSSLGAGFSLFGSARFDGVNSNLCGTADEISNKEGAMSSSNISFSVSGANILINGAGYATENINWSAVGMYTFVGV
jgi:hypothetical protein